MAPLSHDIAGVVLPHETFGSHLDASGKTIDKQLEEQNFYAAADVLSEIWSNTVIDDHKVDCKTVKKGSHFIPDEASPVWIANHVKVNIYFLKKF